MTLSASRWINIEEIKQKKKWSGRFGKSLSTLSPLWEGFQVVTLPVTSGQVGEYKSRWFQSRVKFWFISDHFYCGDLNETFRAKIISKRSYWPCVYKLMPSLCPSFVFKSSSHQARKMYIRLSTKNKHCSSEQIGSLSFLSIYSTLFVSGITSYCEQIKTSEKNKIK